MRIRSLTTFLFVASFLPNAAAADKIETSLYPGTVDGGPTTNISFDFPDCEEECHLATLTCDANGGIALELADVPTEDVTKAMLRDNHQIVLKVGGKDFDFNIMKMSFAELTNAWWVDSQLFAATHGALPAALATATTIEMTVAKTSPTIVLVDDNVKTWAKGCT